MPTKDSSELAAKVRDLLINRPKPMTLAKLHETTGAPIWFMTRLACGHISDGPASRLEKLYETLTGKKINIQ